MKKTNARDIRRNPNPGNSERGKVIGAGEARQGPLSAP